MIHTKFRATALAGASALMLSGCLLSPGQFTSELTLMQDGSFSYSYDGEIQMLALSKLAEMGAKSDEAFKAECFDEDFETTECTAAEVEEQHREWEAEAESRKAKQAREAEQMKAFLGGVDPSNPEAAQDLAETLSRQRGWNAVEYKGDGLFDVDFAISGRMTHDFAFPTIEKLGMANTFVNVHLRDQGQVRVDAPGFAAQGGGNPMQGMFAGMAGMAGLSESGSSDSEDPPRVVVPEGTFSIVTDGRILANNTDEGPAPHARGEVLTWEISPRTEQAPTALIAFN
ncbi:hypothetical protein [Qipengyuania flava]|uniref:hypothetical protein n=1 Tax=Qipengyuania flava TaxID=192812 RepID=UPI001C639F51|nr:hypothetical protein [Qipengyuania flava]QYJ08307.1 hypothetical protein KUV82_06335 [Qipengyuania flava]